MSLYTTLDRHCLLPLSEKLFGRDISTAYRESLRTEWLGREALDALQRERLQRLVRHCYEHVPYYRRLFDRLHLSPAEVQTPADLAKLPVLTKDQVRQHYDELIADDAATRRYLHGSTGGSTGTPLRFLHDVQTWNRLRAAGLRMWHTAGFELGERMFTLAGNSLVKHTKHRLPKAKDLYDRYIMRNLKRNCTDLSPEALAGHYRAMMAYRPKAIRGYASSLYFLARYIEQHQLPVPEVKAVFTTGEKLHPAYRHKLQQVFRVPVFDAYGAADGGVAAYECPLHSGMHLSEENCIVEIVAPDGRPLPDGETGHVLTTDLNNYVFPFLRYQVGDLAYIDPTPCSCGRASRRLGEVIGREGRAIYNKQGRPFSSVVIDNMMFPQLDYHSTANQLLYERMERFQVQQDEQGDIHILIKPVDEAESVHTFDYIRHNFTTFFPDSKVTLSLVRDIPPLPSGKEDYCLSLYHPNL